MNRCRLAKLLLLGIFFSFSAWGLEPFVIEDIRIEGLQRVSAGTVFNYLPVKFGDLFDQRQSAVRYSLAVCTRHEWCSRVRVR